MPTRVVITDCPWEDISVEREILQSVGTEVERFQCSTPDQTIAAAKGADALLVGWAPIDRKVIQSLSKCRIMVRYGAGYNNIDVEAATEAGIAVANNPDYCIDEVAIHALALLLACHRQLGPLTVAVRNGIWDPMKTMKPMPRLSEQVVGIVGYGRMGRRFASLVRPLVSRVLVYDPFVAANDTGVEFAPLENVLAASDYVSVHAPLNDKTRHLIGKEALSQMKLSAFLINCSRGEIVDEQALVQALEGARLGGAALDVFEKEPLAVDHPLRSLPNVLITPHVAWFSSTADYELRARPARMITNYLQGLAVPLLNSPVAKRMG